jgi:hypothetical protein
MRQDFSASCSVCVEFCVVVWLLSVGRLYACSVSMKHTHYSTLVIRDQHSATLARVSTHCTLTMPSATIHNTPSLRLTRTVTGAGGGAAGTPAQRGASSSSGAHTAATANSDADSVLTRGPDPEGALAMSRQLTDCMGKPVHMAGPAIGTCLSCKAPIVHPDRQDLYSAGGPKGGGFQLWG